MWTNKLRRQGIFIASITTQLAFISTFLQCTFHLSSSGHSYSVDVTWYYWLVSYYPLLDVIVLVFDNSYWYLDVSV